MSISDINWKNGKMPAWSRIFLAVAGLLLVAALFLPAWKMELSAPQYPEGLTLYMYPDKLAGDVHSINDLNHYIGMKTLHTEDFVEFTVLPYIIGFFALLSFVSAAVGRKRWAVVTLILLIIFGIVALVDFYKWNYNYGHDLSPTAAIKIPGMAYQPPILGFKQLLNFGVYSIPALGGILMILSGVLMAIVVVVTYRFHRIFCKKALAAVVMTAGMLTLLSCKGDLKARPVQAGKDVCASCQMTVMDAKFAAELVTDKGKYYLFDDLNCMKNFIAEHPDMQVGKLYVADYLDESRLLEAPTAFYIRGGEVESPMNGNIAAFPTAADAEQAAGQLDATVMPWQDLGL